MNATDTFSVVPYIGTWIETSTIAVLTTVTSVVPYIGTWIETALTAPQQGVAPRRTLYRYVD